MDKVITGEIDLKEQVQPSRIAYGGKTVYGARIGLLMLDTDFPRIPGDLGNAETWPFPLLYRVIRGVLIEGDHAGVHPCPRGGSPEDLEKILVRDAGGARCRHEYSVVTDQLEGIPVELGVNAHRMLQIFLFAQQRGWIDDDDVELRPLAGQVIEKRKQVRRHVMVDRAGRAIRFQVLAAIRQGGPGNVEAQHTTRSTLEGVGGKTSRVGKAIQD